MARNPTNSNQLPPTPDELLSLEKVIAELGEPLATYTQALLTADATAKQLQTAQGTRNPNAITDATLEHECAICDVYKLKYKAASQVMFALRCVSELFPGAIQIHLDPVFRRELDITQTALVELEGRLEDLEDAVVRLELEGATR